MRRIRSHLTYANVMVTLLAFVVLAGGAAYAANTIGSADILDGQVKTPDLANNAVKTGKVLDESLTGHDVQDNTIGGADVNESLLDPLTNAQIQDESLTGHDIQNNTIGGADVNESLLDGVAFSPAFSTHDPADFELPADGSYAQVIYTGDGIHGDPLVHVPVPGQIMATASLTLAQAHGSFSDVFCTLGFGKPGQPSDPFGAVVGQKILSTETGGNGFESISLTGAREVNTPGDYYLNVVCRSSNRVTGDLDRATFQSGSLIAWAT